MARLLCKTFILLQINNHLRELGDPGVSLVAHEEQQAVSAHAAPVYTSDFLLISLFTVAHFIDEGCFGKELEHFFFNLEITVLSDIIK